MVIRKIRVFSAAKIGGILGAVAGLLAGLLIAALSSLGGAAALAGQQGADATNAGALLGMGAGAIILFPLMYAVIGFLGGALQAFVYNIAARFVGGLQVETD